MVCKEEVLSWFKDLESYNRIDVVYALLNMCVPFELRFLGTCLEEFGRHTYQELRGQTITANNVDKLKKDPALGRPTTPPPPAAPPTNPSLLDETVRHRTLIYLSLVASRNCTAADWLYRRLLRTDFVDEAVLMRDVCKNELLLNEFLLVYTMALHHPAFTFDQKQDFWAILGRLLEVKESSKARQVHMRPDYPPGLGFPKKKVEVPVKTPPFAEIQMHQPPPGLPHMMAPPPVEMYATPLGNRPGFPACGAPEVPAFPNQSISPLVSQAGSPCHSRSGSPLRGLRPPVVPPPPISTLEMLAPSSLPLYNATELKMTDEELSSLPEEKQLRDLQWPLPVPAMVAPPPVELKPNGMRFAPPFSNTNPKKPPPPQPRPPYLVEVMQMLNLDGENYMHQSNSSSNSSPIQTPPDTPSGGVVQVVHGPGRGGDKSPPNVNGLPPPQPFICDTTSPPPPTPAAGFSTVPYNYPQTFQAPPPPNRSMFHYSATPFRQGFSAPFPYQTDSFTNYPVPYVSIMYSSPFAAAAPRTPPSCYNCGAGGHIGAECTAQTIEDITQKKTYQLDYAAALPPDGADK